MKVLLARCVPAVALLLWASASSNSMAAGPLFPSTFIDTSSGFGIASGTVSTGHVIFNFDASGGDTVSVGVSVTDIFPGTMFTDDDSIVFLFDGLGRLIASNDDTDPFQTNFQSLIENFAISTTGTYFVGVTTFDNNPILDPGGVITDWEDDGGSSIGFDLFVFRTSAVPEPSTLVLYSVGLLGLLCYVGWTGRRTWPRHNANRHGIVERGESIVRHCLTALNVGGSRQQPDHQMSVNTTLSATQESAPEQS